MNAIIEQKEIFKRNTEYSKAEKEAVEIDLQYLKEKMETLLKERNNYELNKKLLQDKLID
jgi:hypothetical protein